MEQWAKGEHGEKKKARAIRKLAPLKALDRGVESYWAAFWFLNQSRHYAPSGAPCGLLMIEKQAYLDEQGIEEIEERRRSMRFISALDTAYIAHFLKKMKARNNA